MRRPPLEWTLLAAGVLAVVAVVLGGNAYQQQFVASTAVFVILAYGWNVISGITGYLSFGQIAFFGLGAYVALGVIATLHLPWYAALVIAPLAAAAVALVLGGVMLRLQGVFFTLGMFGLARVFEIVAGSVQGGAMGASSPVVATPRDAALVALALALGAIALNRVLVGSRLGLRCMAIRDDEPAARAAGVAAARI
ncbi:MAG TPA: hypothetical protein VGN14_09690, partial [Candidatus Elarobacter sp.]